MSERRWEEIVNRMKTAIREGDLPRGTRLPSETLFATQWSISRMTAHRVMQELQEAGLVERRPGAGTIVAPRRRLRTVAVLLHDTRLNPQAAYLQGIAEVFGGTTNLRLCDTGGQPEREAAHLENLADRADGAIVFPTASPENSLRLAALARTLPLVSIDRVPPGAEVDAVVVDEFNSSLEGLRILTTKGHRRIAHLTSGTFHVSSVRGRFEAYLAALAEIGMTGAEYLRIVEDEGSSFRGYAARVRATLEELMNLPSPPTALFCLHDDATAATLAACERMGLSVPGDLDVLSVNDTPALPIFGLDMVYRIVPPTLELGRAAAQRLIELSEDPNLTSEIRTMRSTVVPPGA